MSEISGNATSTWFENGAVVSQSTVYCAAFAASADSRRSGYWPHTALFCGECGEIWRRRFLTYHFDYSPAGAGPPWSVEVRTCPGCEELSTRRIFAELMKEYE